MGGWWWYSYYTRVGTVPPGASITMAGVTMKWRQGRRTQLRVRTCGGESERHFWFWIQIGRATLGEDWMVFILLTESTNQADWIYLIGNHWKSGQFVGQCIFFWMWNYYLDPWFATLLHMLDYFTCWKLEREKERVKIWNPDPFFHFLNYFLSY